jgi:hypothetical protein
MNSFKKFRTHFSLFMVFLLCWSPVSSQIRLEVPQPPLQTSENSIKATTTAPNPSAVQPDDPEKELAGEKIKLYYFREGTKIATVLNAIKTRPNSKIKDLIIQTASEDEIVLYGSEEQRDIARRIIVTLDLPRPGITMDMWGIQISSKDPDKLAKVMLEVRGVIDETQQDIRETFARMQDIARRINSQREFETLLVKDLGFRSALDPARPLSFTDILMLMVASRDPSSSALEMASELTSFGSIINAKFNKWKNDPQNKKYTKDLPDRGGPTFARFLSSRGLILKDGQWTDDKNDARLRALQSRAALLEFGLHYGNLVHHPDQFSPYYLQQAAETLNSRLQAATDVLNQDIQDLFVVPTLTKIQTIVRKFKEVEYAQVGKTSVASLNGIQTEVSSYSVSAFETVPPLRLSELLTKADELSKKAGGFVPKPADNLVGAMPLSQVIGLIGAFGEERAVWRELKSGVSITVTPNVLRNMTSAELQLNLKTGDPQAGTRESGVPPLSRVSQHDVKTSLYVNTLDFFDISSFGNESTLGSGRGYVPIIGPVWRGLFYDIPVFGKLFSWKKDPQTVHHESLILTTSFIVPTVMGVAVLYPNDLSDKGRSELDFDSQKNKVKEFNDSLKEDIRRLISGRP